MGVNGICAGIQKNGSYLVDPRCISSRILRVKFKFVKVKVCVVGAYNPMDGYNKGKKGLCSDLGWMMQWV